MNHCIVLSRRIQGVSSGHASLLNTFNFTSITFRILTVSFLQWLGGSSFGLGFCPLLMFSTKLERFVHVVRIDIRACSNFFSRLSILVFDQKPRNIGFSAHVCDALEVFKFTVVESSGGFSLHFNVTSLHTTMKLLVNNSNSLSITDLFVLALNSSAHSSAYWSFWVNSGTPSTRSIV